MDEVLSGLAEDYPLLTNLALLAVAALLMWGFFRWMDRKG